MVLRNDVANPARGLETVKRYSAYLTLKEDERNRSTGVSKEPTKFTDDGNMLALHEKNQDADVALGNVKPSDNEAKNKELIQSLRRDLASANRRLPQQPQQWAPGHQSQCQAVAHVGQQAQSWSSDQVYSSDYAHASQDHRGSGYDGGGPSSATAHGEEYMVANVDTRPGLGRGAVGGGSRGTGGRGVGISTGAGGGRGAGTSTNPTPGGSQ